MDTGYSQAIQRHCFQCVRTLMGSLNREWLNPSTADWEFTVSMDPLEEGMFLAES